MSHSSYSSIEQLRHLIKDVEHYYKNKCVADTLPTLRFTGTIKLHGTNAGIGYNNKDGLWCQSRSNIITPKQDNAGCAFFVESNKQYFIDTIKMIATNNMIDLDTNSLILFGEWCGTGIQKGVAISKLPRMFVAFDVKVVPNNGDDAYYIDTTLPEIVNNDERKIYNIYLFKTFTIDIDFNNIAGQGTDCLREIIDEVEKCCPFGKALGAEGVGEGVVFKHHYSPRGRYIFKLKGDEHKVSKEKVKIEVAPEVIASINEFCDRTVSDNRLTQAIDMIFHNNPALPTYNTPIEMKHVQKIITWMRDDIWKEEMDVMVANKLEPNMVFSELAKRTSSMFKRRVEGF